MLQLAPMILLLGKQLFFFCLFERSQHQFIRLLTYAILNISPPTYFPLSIFSSLSLSLFVYECLTDYVWNGVRKRERDKLCVLFSKFLLHANLTEEMWKRQNMFQRWREKKNNFSNNGFPPLILLLLRCRFLWLPRRYVSLSLSRPRNWGLML